MRRLIIMINNIFFIQIYYFIEKIDGERGTRLINYKIGEKIKIICLKHIIN